MTKVAIIGAGIGGLVAASLLSAKGHDVVICETAATPGGKLRELTVGATRIDAGPTVFTLRPIFEAIFAQAGARLTDHLTLEPLDILARHAWEDGCCLDLRADISENIAAIRTFGGEGAARGYAEFATASQRIFETLDQTFMQIPQPGLSGLVRRAGPGLLGISPFATLWDALGKYFKDPRLRQLFARYATYCGSSPFVAPATLMLIAHAEQRGVWRIAGGMGRLAYALESVAKTHGATFNYGNPVTEILTRNNRASGLRLANGDKIAAEHIIANVELAALDSGLFGPAAKHAVSGMMKDATPSLSAITWAATGHAESFTLAHHNVFFTRDYVREFAELSAGRLPEDPTIYLCAPNPGEYFILINAPPGIVPTEQELDQCWKNTNRKLKACGLHLTLTEQISTSPSQFSQMFPASQGALYGRALSGWRDPFRRPGPTTKLPGLLLAGGSAHPGPGLPMAAISGRIAANSILQQK